MLKSSASSSTTDTKRTKLHEAIERQDEGKLRKLLKTQKSIKDFTVFDEHGQTPLNAAIARFDYLAVEKILDFLRENNCPEW